MLRSYAFRGIAFIRLNHARPEKLRMVTVSRKGNLIMKAYLTKKNGLYMLLSLILPALILSFRPFGLDGTQAFLLAVLVMVVFWWVANCMPKWVSSLFLLLIFSIFGKTPLQSVFQFPLSDNFIVILFAFLFSQGIANSGLTKRLLQPLFYRWIHTPAQFLLFVILCNIALIFVIPQPFARIILFAFIAAEYLENVCEDEKRRSVLMFAVFLFSMTSNMMFLRGDIIMNYAVQSFGEIAISEGEWAKAMALPTLLLIAAELGVILLLYRKTLCGVRFSVPKQMDGAEEPLGKRDRSILGLVLLTMLLLATGPLHGIAGKWIILASTVIMFVIGLLKPRDIKSINFNLLVWLTAAFSLGNVMRASGIADCVFSRLSGMFPSEFGLVYLLVIVVITMGLHMLLGGSVTSTSVIIPGILEIASGKADPAMLVLIIYLLVYNHFLLPIHNAVLVIGNGDKRFDNSVVMKVGAAMTAVMPLFVIFVYRGWWQMTGIF